MHSGLLDPGARVARYEILKHIATGGMGAVYKATDCDLRRPVALKILPADVDPTGPQLERFRREARHAACLCHPNIVTLYDFGYDAQLLVHYLAMEYIDGINLHDYIQDQGQLKPAEARRILLPVVLALDHAHAQGIVHRDIKPANILLARVDDKLLVKLTDLGLARRPTDEDFKVTREGNTVGTIDYMAPEQARDSGTADIRSDIYSLGCTAYHMLAGKAPFAEGGLGERILKHLNAAPPDVREFNPAVSAGLWAILQKMLAKVPADRYPTPRELFLALKSPEESIAKTVARPRQPAREARRGSPPPRPLQPVPHPRPRSDETTEPSLPTQTLISLEQARAAAAFHERAIQVLTQGRGDDYARELLANCLKLDPFNAAYRKTLRAMNRAGTRGFLTRWLGSFTVLTTKSKLRLAVSKGDWRKVLELGEEVLACQPDDTRTHLELAAAAQKLDLPSLARWFLEDATAQAPENVVLIRALAIFHEGRHEWKRSVTLWQRIRELAPGDFEAARKINDLSAQDILVNGHYSH